MSVEIHTHGLGLMESATAARQVTLCFGGTKLHPACMHPLSLAQALHVQTQLSAAIRRLQEMTE